MDFRRTTLATFLLLAACSEARDRGPVTPPTTTPPTSTPCGNGAVEGFEACDGSAVANGATCAGLGLGAGSLACTNECQLNLSTCDFSDYCTANGLYENGLCDPCEALGGVRDPECAVACGADGVCNDRFEPLVGGFVCRLAGQRDPDCGSCGNGIVEGSELCDGQTFPMGQHRCEDWGYVAGAISCRSDCTPDFGQCRAVSCGDGMIEGAETCDGADVAGATCEGMGFAGGTIACGSNCRIDTSACVNPGCGNAILESDEECESGQLGATTCATLGFAGGALGCSGTCTFDTAACVSPGCGNGIIEPPIEECEGTDFGGQTCMSQGFLQGTLACSATSCTFDTSGCIAPGCGNGIVEPSEDCEGMNLNNATCTSLGFAAGTLTCDSRCDFDTSQCVMSGCGNGIIEAGEACDGMNLGGASCYTETGGVGRLSCVQCQLSATQCRNTCGDGVVNAHELCDGTLFRNNASTACADLGLGTGTVSCNSSCRLNLNGCSTDVCTANFWYNDGACDPCHLLGGMVDPDCAGCSANGACVDYFSGTVGMRTCAASNPAITIDPDCLPACGNGTIDDGEACDGTAFAATELGTCSYYGFTSGTVGCTPACVPDPSLCL